MKIIKLLLISSLPSYAGKIYRFIEKDGVSTLSKSLPPYAAQKGYDILDDTSLRLIERVYTREELVKIQQRQAVIEQKNALLEQQKKEAQQRRLEQRSHDRNLIARYPSSQLLIKSRNDDLTYRQHQIDDAKNLLKNNISRLKGLQQKAAEQEMSGNEISVNLTKRLSVMQEEINNKRYISRTKTEKEEASRQYDIDLERLKLLLDITSKKPEN